MQENEGQDEPTLTIGVFSRRSRLSVKALRVYDRLGLLAPAHVDAATGYRTYAESQLEDARLVVRLRRLEMPLADVAAVLAAPAEARVGLLTAYWDGVERRFASQRELLAHLRIRMSGGTEGFDMYDVTTREVPEQRVLVEQRHVTQPELMTWLPDAFVRVATLATQHGGISGPAFAIFHGEVNEDSDGPVEVCVPIDNLPADPPGVAVRHEPAHREAYVRLRKAQVEFPQILSAYDAVVEWLRANGMEVGGPPREIYFTDFMAAGPEDEVCDVAYPLSRG